VAQITPVPPDRYDLLDRLGEGGMGVVYMARDLRLNRVVALKFLHPSLVSSPEARARFQREAHAISSLHHPGIATIHDVELDADQPFLVLEYLGGGTLRSRTQGRILDIEEIASYGRSMAAALAHAHRHGIVHRDLKPSNVLFDSEGHLKIADFGLAKARDSTVTAEGLIMGTVAYMSPEQASGRDVDPRSDIFSLGVILYELASGRRPFTGDHPAVVISQIVHDEPEPLAELRPDLPLTVHSLVGRAMEKKLDRRFQRMEDIERALAALSTLDSAATATRTDLRVPTSPTRVIPKRWQPWVLVVMALALLALIVPFKLLPRLLRSGLLPAERRVAVLPFDASAADAETQAFAAALPDLVANLLAQSEQFESSLSVVPPTEVRRQRVRSIADAHTNFNVNLALGGTIVGSGAARQIILTLSDAAALKQLASRVITAPPGDPRSLDASLTSAMLELLELDMSLRARDLANASKPGSARAHEIYLRAQGVLRAAESPEAIDRAVALFEDVTREEPAFALAWCSLAEAHLRRFSMSRDSASLALADQAVDRAFAVSPRLAQAFYTRALIRRATGRYEEAIDNLNQALTLDSSHYEAHRLHGALFDQTGKITEAEQAYQQAVRLKPSFWPTYANLGAFYYSHGKMAEAEEAFQTAVRLAPNNQANHRNLGSLYLVLGRHAEGEQALRRSIALRPTAPALSNLGAHEFFRGNYAESARLFEEALKLDPHDAVSWGQLGEACSELPALRDRAPAHFKKAIEVASRQLTVNPRQPNLLASLAVFEAKLGRTPQALDRLRHALDLAPNDGRILIKAARVYEIVRRRDQAVAALRQAVALGLPLWEIEGNRDLEPVRKDPRFQRALTAPSKP
jgi:serine/threonine-protein kinase